MKKDDLWLDSCAYSHAALDPSMGDLPDKLRRDIYALKKIKQLLRDRTIEMGISLNALLETSGNPDHQAADAFWRDANLATYPQEVGLAGHRIASSSTAYEGKLYQWEQQLRPIASRVGDYPGKDTALLLNCSWFGGTFITTDYKFLNKLGTEGRNITFLTAMCPSEYVARIDQSKKVSS